MKKKVQKAKERVLDMAKVTLGTMVLNLMIIAVTKATNKLNDVISKSKLKTQGFEPGGKEREREKEKRETFEPRYQPYQQYHYPHHHPHHHHHHQQHYQQHHGQFYYQ